MKPGGLSRGRNICLFDKYHEILHYTGLLDIDNSESITKKSWVVQKYIENPLIILNRKFDIRVWVIVSSWNPLKVFYYNQPYVRFGAQDYDTSNIGNLFSHLTNNSINSKMLRMADDKKFDKIPGNMWFLK